MMRIAVCDDEKVYRDTIVKYLESVNEEASKEKSEENFEENSIEVFEFGNGEALVEACTDGCIYDLIFLDVEMDGLTGVETGVKIRELNQNVLIIFVTSHQSYVPEAFRLQAFQYLVKPVSYEAFQKEFARAADVIRKNKEKYIVKNRDRVDYIEIKDITYIEVFGRNLLVHTTGNTYTMNGKIKDEYLKLKEYGFVQCHKSMVVNLRYVKSVDEQDVILKTDEKVMLSKRLKPDIMMALNHYLAGRVL